MAPSDSITADHDARRVPFGNALAVAIGTSALFMVFYGGAAYLTSMRSDVATWYYDWESVIPFVPIMIIPYMSIDAFFFLAPFVCRDRRELRLLTIRLSAVVVLASAAFLIYPLQLAVERPIAAGFIGSIYNWFTSMDKPYNLCPSMHIALRAVLAVHFSKHTRGCLRGLINGWFFLIGCSTLLLYQHHVIDVVGGFILAVAIMYVVDGRTWKTPVRPNIRFASLYGTAGAVLLLPMTAHPSWGWIVLWPAVACFLVAAAYLGLGPAIYRLRDGELSWPAKIILGPVLLAQRLSWWHYRKQAEPINEIADHVSIGRWHSGREAAQTTESFAGVVNVCVAFDSTTVASSAEHLHLPVLDLTAPTEDQLCTAVAFIENHRSRGRVLIHCKAGFSRSAAVAAAWLVATGRAVDCNDAFERIRDVRPQIVIRPEIANLDFARLRNSERFPKRIRIPREFDDDEQVSDSDALAAVRSEARHTVLRQ